VIAIDSSVLIDFLNGRRTRQVERFFQLAQNQEVVIGDLILCEVLQGIADERQARTTEALLREHHLVPMCSPELAVRAATNYRSLRRLGFTVRRTVDVIIGTYCIENDVPLLHADRDFEPMERHLGLKPA
jgi:predicted nucleic acid-binding protein